MQNSLIGSWIFVDSIMTDIYGEKIEPPEADWKGLLIYTSTHDVAVQLSNSTTHENSTFVKSNYSAYYGKYQFDETRQIVTHEIINSNIPTLVGATIQRQVTFHATDFISLKLIEPETFATHQPIYWELFWKQLP